VCLSLRGKKRANKKTLSSFICTPSSFNPNRFVVLLSKSEVTTRRRRRPRRIPPPPLHQSNLALSRFLQHQPIPLFFFFCFFSFDIRSRRFRFRRVLIGGGVRTIINLRSVARRGSFRSNQIAGTPFRSTRWKGESRLLLLASSTNGFGHCIVIGFRNKGSDFGFR